MIVANKADTVIAEAEDYENQYINSDTFIPTGEKLGQGCFGVVHVYTDQGGHEWGIKKFAPNEVGLKLMAEKGLTEEDVMRNESIPLSAAHDHVVPRIIERDKDGRLYVAMPVYKGKDLSKEIRYLGLREALNITKDVASAASWFHKQKTSNGKTKTHSDIKPANSSDQRFNPSTINDILFSLLLSPIVQVGGPPLHPNICAS